MADFVSQLQSMLGGGAQSDPSAMGMTNFGAAPTAQGYGGAVLARLRSSALPQFPQQQAQTSPAAAAMMGAVNVDPTLSKGGAFFSGVANGLASQRQVQVQDAQLAAQQRMNALTAQEKIMQLAKMQRDANGVGAVSQFLGGAPMSAPNPSPVGGGSMPQGGGGAPPPMPQSGPVPTQSGQPPIQGAPGDGSPPPMQVSTNPGGAPQSTDAAPAPVIPLENQPGAILARAGKLSAAADLALRSGNTDLANQLSTRAAQEQQRATAMINSGKTIDGAGNEIALPGHMRVLSDEATAKTSAEEAAKNAARPTVTPSGAEYVGGSPGPAQAAPAAATINDTPAKLQVDPETATVKTSIPSAPVGGGYAVPVLPPGAKLTKVGPNAAETAKADANFDDLISKAPAVDQSIERLQAAAQSLKLFQSGSTAERLNAGASLAESYGFHDLAQKIQGGDPAALQWLNKEGVNLTLSTLSAAQPRFAQSEFKALAASGMPDPDKLPQANHQVVSEMLGGALRNQAFIRDWQVAQQKGWQSPSAFYAKWGAANPQDGFTAAAQRQIGSFKGMNLPPSSQWTTGATYVAPTASNPKQAAFFQSQGVQPGQQFRYNGPKAAKLMDPVPVTQAYSAHLGAQ